MFVIHTDRFVTGKTSHYRLLLVKRIPDKNVFFKRQRGHLERAKRAFLRGQMGHLLPKNGTLQVKGSFIYSAKYPSARVKKRPRSIMKVG